MDKRRFQAWTSNIASLFGYEVRFAGIRSMIMEDSTRKELGKVDDDMGSPPEWLFSPNSRSGLTVKVIKH